MSDIAHRGAEASAFFYHPNRPWKVILPPVYRYLPMEFVDAFFETGALRLSSFKQFTKHADEARLDVNEGQSHVMMLGEGRHFGAMMSGGHNAYVLCGSTTLSSELLRKFEGSEGVIEITNVPEFASAVARQLAGFVSGVSGHCIYTGKRILMRHVPYDPFPLPNDSSEQVPVEQMLAAAAQAGQDEEKLLKERQYAYQAEYRLLWNIDKEVPEYIDLKSLEARQFCRRVSSEELQ